MVIAELLDHKIIIEKVISELIDPISEACEMVKTAIKDGKKVILAGNGGSAADAQHIAAELSGRFLKERCSLPGLALTTDTSALTAIANDYGYDHVFSRQVEAFACAGDVFIGISTSGNSESILNAINAARDKDCRTLALTGKGGGAMVKLCDTSIVIPSDVTARIQEMHILVGHILCKAIDDMY